MAGQDHVIEAASLATIVNDLDAPWPAAHGCDRRRQADVGPEFRHQPLDILARAAGDGSPVMLPADAQQAMVGKEPQKAVRGMVEHAGHRCRPDGRCHRQQIPVGQALAETVPDQELAHRGLVLGLLAQMAPPDPVEPLDIQQHPQEPRPQYVAALGQQGTGRTTSILHGTVADAGRERHRGRLGRHLQMGEQPGQQRVGVLVVHHEAGIDGYGTVRGGDGNGMGMPAGPRLRLENRDRMPAVEQPSRCEAGDAGADNGDPHEFLSPQRAYAVAAITTPTGSDRVGWVTLRDSSALGSSERWRDVFT